MEWRAAPWHFDRRELYVDGKLVAWTQPCPRGTFVRVRTDAFDVMQAFGDEDIAMRYAENAVRDGVPGRV